MGIIRLNQIERNVNRMKNEPIIKDNPIYINKRAEGKTIIEEPNLKIIRTRDIDETWDNLMDIGWINRKPYPLGPFEGIVNTWKNQPCFIIGSGPDLKVFIKTIGWDFLNDKKTIGINHVIESYDKFKWFMFLDRRFLKKTTYNLQNFKGKIFAQNNAGLADVTKNIVRFRALSSNAKPTEKIQKGLYSNRFSGLVALHLAILSGANPIYLIGFGMGKSGNEKRFHFRGKYQGVGQKPKEQYKKYIRTYKAFNKFNKWATKIVHVTEGQSLADFNKLSFPLLKDRFTKKKFNIKKGIQPKVVHLSFSDDINIHADITRYIINNCYGRHSLSTFNRIPAADLYVTEHFISTNKQVLNFPYKNKCINIVHTMNCYPKGNFLINVALTKVWKNILLKRGVKNIRVIPGGIETKLYKNIVRNENSKIFGRITRWSPGKIPPWWNRMIVDILNSNKDISCLMFIDNRNRSRKLLNHDRMIYDYSCEITDFKGNWLKKLSIYVHANGTFKETLSHAVIEAMATGLPIVYIKEPALNEVVGSVGIAVNNENELKNAILKLLNDKKLCKNYEKLSKSRSKMYDIKFTVEKFSTLIKEVCP